MKTTSLTGLVLSLLMLLLVLLAAFVFLFQGRQKLLNQRDALEAETADLEQDLSQTETNLTAAEATQTAAAIALATAESNAVLLDGELVRSQQEVDALTEQLDAASQTITTLQSAQEAVLAQPPEVAILAPTSGRVLPQGEPVNIVMVATDPKGVSLVNLAINAEPVETFMPENETLFTAVSTWEPAEANEYVIQLTAVNSEGISSRSATVTVTVALANTASRTADDDHSALRQDISDLVSGLRQLPPVTNINEQIVSGVLLRQAQATDALALAESGLWRSAGVLGWAFDFAPAEFAYADLLTAFYGAPTPALYRPLADELLIIEQENTPTAMVQLGYVRQFLYLLQDQNFGLDQLILEENTLDQALALAALSEGEATVVQENFLVARYLPLETAVIPETYAIDTTILADVPTAVANRLLFPYEYGDEFARVLFENGGYPALDEAWRSPPQSTEQLLHPEKYLANEGPSLVTLPDLHDLLGEPWTLSDENVLGEFLLAQYLLQQLNETQVETAVSGWGGDRFAIYTNETTGERLLVWQTVWDTAADSTEFAALYPNYPTRQFGSSGEIQANGGECWQGEAELICLYQFEQETLVVRGPDMPLILEVVNAIFPAE